MNDWSKLLLAFRDGKFPEYDYGLTPRFVVGACQIPIGAKLADEKTAWRVTKQMFAEMCGYDTDGHVVTSNLCPKHGGPVVQLAERKWDVDAIGTKFSEIWKRYGDEIVSGNYHISPKEMKILKEIYPEQNAG